MKSMQYQLNKRSHQLVIINTAQCLLLWAKYHPHKLECKSAYAYTRITINCILNITNAYNLVPAHTFPVTKCAANWG